MIEMKHDISVCYAASRAYLPYLKASLASLPKELEKIVVWYDPQGRALDLSIQNLKIINWETKLENWQKASAVNFAVRHAERQWVLLADADILFPDVLFPALCAKLEGAEDKTIYHFFFAKLNRDRTSAILSGEKTWGDCYEKYEGAIQYVPPSLLTRLLAKICTTFSKSLFVEFGPQRIGYEIIFGNINPCVFNKEFFLKLGGYDTRFVGWGGEDDDLERRSQESGGIDVRLPIVVAHLWHPRIMDFNNYLSGSSIYGKNKE